MKKYRSLAIKLTVSTMLIIFLLSQVDKDMVLQNFSLLDLRYIFLIVFLLVANYLVSAIRWKKLLIHKDGQGIKTTYLAKLYFEGAFFNNFMPTSMGGDVYKIYALGKKLENGAHAFSSTFMERFTGMIALVLISYFGFFQTLDYWLSLLPDFVVQNSILVIFFEVAVLGGFWVGFGIAVYLFKFISTKHKKVKELYDVFMEYKGKWNVLGWAFVTSFIVQFIAIFTQYFVFKGMGVDLPITYALAVIPVITLAGFFIPSLNGVGVQDALYVQFFMVVGVSPELALSASIIYHLFRLFVSLFGGVSYAINKS